MATRSYAKFCASEAVDICGYYVITGPMKAQIVRIGNSRGIRLPKSVLEQCRLEDEVTLHIVKNRLIVEPVKAKPRQGWDQAFAEMHELGDDNMLLPDGVDADLKDWKW